MIPEHDLQQKYEAIFPLLNERQHRVIAAADALFLGRGGVSQVARASGLSRTTIHRGLDELKENGQADTRIRQAGGGRKSVVAHSPEILAALEALVEPATRGDPMSPLRWTCKSTRQLLAALERQGYAISPPTVASENAINFRRHLELLEEDPEGVAAVQAPGLTAPPGSARRRYSTP